LSVSNIKTFPLSPQPFYNPSLTLPNFFQPPSFVKRGRGRFFKRIENLTKKFRDEKNPSQPSLASLIFPPLEKRGHRGEMKSLPNLPLHP